MSDRRHIQPPFTVFSSEQETLRMSARSHVLNVVTGTFKWSIFGITLLLSFTSRGTLAQSTDDESADISANVADSDSVDTTKQSREEKEPKAEPEAPAFFRLDYSGDLWERPAITGDWGGLRNELAAERGISFELELEQFIQGNAHGGKDTNNAFRYSESWDLRFKFATGRMGLWPGGLLELHSESFFGQSINRKVGSPVNDDALFPLPGSREVMV